MLDWISEPFISDEIIGDFDVIVSEVGLSFELSSHYQMTFGDYTEQFTLENGMCPDYETTLDWLTFYDAITGLTTDNIAQIEELAHLIVQPDAEDQPQTFFEINPTLSTELGIYTVEFSMFRSFTGEEACEN